jgi:hypothetical protein
MRRTTAAAAAANVTTRNRNNAKHFNMARGLALLCCVEHLNAYTSFSTHQEGCPLSLPCQITNSTFFDTARRVCIPYHPISDMARRVTTVKHLIILFLT